MTILEVLLALLVLVVALAGIGSLTTMGRQSGADARDLTMGQLLCEGKMAEISSGILPAGSSSGIFQEDPDWIFNVQSSPADTPGLLSVRVTVTQNPQTYDQPMEFVLVRWVPDPNYAAELAQ
jgi:Tfp pilus assembly protein PilV